MDKSDIFKTVPVFLQELVLSIYNTYLYKKRYGKIYRQKKHQLKELQFAKLETLISLQQEELNKFVKNTSNKSSYYKLKYKDVNLSDVITVHELQKFPILKKEEVLSNLDDIATGPTTNAKISKTGGTTGNSMKVYYDPKDIEERFAFLDTFRERYNFKLGKKTAFFNGKSFINQRDVKSRRYWKYDFINKIKFYSTFHINDSTALNYLESLSQFKPDYIIGFPSSIYELAKFGLRNSLDLGGHKVKAIFPTAETLIQKEVDVIQRFFGGLVHDQYASSEGAPFITACERGFKHFEMLSGVVETVNDQDEPANPGRMLVTSFSTTLTPLIRYDIGDRMEWDEDIGNNCVCGRSTPVVKYIHGRVNDFIYSRERGRINLGNVSNCVKGVRGVVKFQIVQNDFDAILVKVIKDDRIYQQIDENKFLKELRLRLGDKINIHFDYPSTIPKENSGKFRIVKNSLNWDL